MDTKELEKAYAKLNEALLLNVISLQLASFEYAIKELNPELYDKYINEFNRLIETDSNYLSLVREMKEAKEAISLLGSISSAQGEA